MNRSLTIVLFVLSLIAPTMALSQTSNTIDFSRAPLASKDVVETIAGNMIVVYDAEIPTAAMFSKSLTGDLESLAGKLAAINVVLSDLGLEAKSASQGRIVISRQVQTEPSESREDSGKPIPGDKASWQAWFDRASQEEREAYRMRRGRPGYDPCLYGDGGCTVSGTGLPHSEYGGSTYAYERGGRTIPLPAWWRESQRNFVNRGEQGGLKTQGDTKGVLIFARGCFVADAEEIDSPTNQKAAIPAGDAITFTAVRVKDWKAYDLPVRPASQAVNESVGARHLTLNIRKQLFDAPGSRTFDLATAKSACETAVR